MARKLIFVSLIVMAFFAATAGLARAEESNFSSYVSDDCIFYASVEKFPNLLVKMDKSPLGDLWQENETKVFIGKLVEFLEMGSEGELYKNLGINYQFIIDFGKNFNGQAVFIIDSVEWQEGVQKIVKPEFVGGELQYTQVEQKVNIPVPHIAIFASVADKAKMESMFEGLIVKIKERVEAPKDGTKLIESTEAYKGFDLKYIRHSKEKDKVICRGFVDNVFFLSIGDAAVKKFIDNRSDPMATKTLAKNPDFKACLSQLGGAKDSVMFFNCKSAGKYITEAFKQVAAESDMPDASQFESDFVKVLDLAGVLDVKFVAANFEMVQNSIVYSAFLSMPGAKRGLPMLLENHKGAFKCLSAAPKDNTFFMAAHMAPEEMYDEMFKIMKEVLPKMKYNEMLKGAEQLNKELGFNFRNEFLASMDSEAGIFVNFKNFKLDAIESMNISNMYDIACIIMVKDRINFEKSLNTLLNTFPFKATEVTYQQYKLKVYQLPGFELTYALTNNMFIIGTTAGTKACLDAVTTPANSLAQAPEYIAALKTVPVNEESVYISYINTRKYINAVYGDMKSNFEKTLPTSDDPKTKLLVSVIKAMPSKETLLKYFNPSLDVLYASPSGFIYKSVSTLTK